MVPHPLAYRELVLNSRTPSILSQRLTFCECRLSAVFGLAKPLLLTPFPPDLLQLVPEQAVDLKHCRMADLDF